MEEKDLDRLAAARNRICQHFGWPPTSSHVFTAIRAIGYGKGIAVGVEKAEAIADRLDEQSKRIAEIESGSRALRDVIAERRKQIEKHKWNASHDDAHGDGVLVRAAVCYARGSKRDWPWENQWWKPEDYRSNLLKAAALLVAEIERYDREQEQFERYMERVKQRQAEAQAAAAEIERPPEQVWTDLEDVVVSMTYDRYDRHWDAVCAIRDYTQALEQRVKELEKKAGEQP